MYRKLYWAIRKHNATHIYAQYTQVGYLKITVSLVMKINHIYKRRIFS